MKLEIMTVYVDKEGTHEVQMSGALVTMPQDLFDMAMVYLRRSIDESIEKLIEKRKSNGKRT